MNMHVGSGAKFKVGDRVRWKEDYGNHKKGDIVTVQSVWSGMVGTDTHHSAFAYRFELAPKFAVGDKVRNKEIDTDDIGEVISVGKKSARVKYNSAFYGTCTEPFDDIELAPSYHSCAAAEVDNLADEYGGGCVKFVAGDRVRAVDGTCLLEIGTDHVVSKSNDEDVWIDIDTGYGVRSFSYPHCYFVAVAPATATAPAATLRIEAGKFYKTRDGRKVGPMIKECGGTVRAVDGTKSLWFFDTGRMNCLREADGDLIAEWRDEPVVAATTAKFKVGDRVTQRGWSAKDHATVIASDDKSITIRDDMGNVGHYTHVEFFELVKPIHTPPTSIADIVRKHTPAGSAIVCLLENGQPKPSEIPHVHAAAWQAGHEASRLAHKHKGQEFGVYELVDVRKVEKPVVAYDFEWQTLAKDGKVIPAIKELRRLSGVGLKAAKDSVENWLSHN